MAGFRFFIFRGTAHLVGSENHHYDSALIALREARKRCSDLDREIEVWVCDQRVGRVRSLRGDPLGA
jgi:hypothetical protein